MRDQPVVSDTAVIDGDFVSPRPWPADYTPTEWVRGVVGSTFRGWDDYLYECVAYDPRMGFWMVRIDSSSANGHGPLAPVPLGDAVRNVSERAIGRTFHVHRARP